MDKVDSQSTPRIGFQSTYLVTEHDADGGLIGDSDILSTDELDSGVSCIINHYTLLRNIRCRTEHLHLGTKPSKPWAVEIISDPAP